MEKTIEISEKTEFKIDGGELVARGPTGEIRRKFKDPEIKIQIKDNKIVISSKSERKKVRARLGTWTAHIKNMLKGAEKEWICKLKLVYSHFPAKLEVKDNKILIQNFLGERKSRIAKLFGDVKVEIKKDDVIVTGKNKEEVGQTAANIEKATRVTGYDRRIFQDGCYITSKPHQE